MNVIDSFKEREPKGEFTVVIKGYKKSNNSKFNTSFLISSYSLSETNDLFLSK